MHQHSLTSNLVIGDKGLHCTRSERLQKLVFLSEFHPLIVIAVGIDLQAGALSNRSKLPEAHSVAHLCAANPALTQDYTAYLPMTECRKRTAS
jgi:hypothetical protein